MIIGITKNRKQSYWLLKGPNSPYTNSSLIFLISFVLLQLIYNCLLHNYFCMFSMFPHVSPPLTPTLFLPTYHNFCLLSHHNCSPLKITTAHFLIIMATHFLKTILPYPLFSPNPCPSYAPCTLPVLQEM